MVEIPRGSDQQLHPGICLVRISCRARDELAGVPAAHGAVLDLFGDVRDIGDKPVDGLILLCGAVGQGLRTLRHLVGTVVDFPGDLRDIAHDTREMGTDAFQALCQHAEIANIVRLVLRHIDGDIAVRHLAEDPSDVIDGLAQAVTDVVDRLRDQTDLILSAIEGSQLLIRGEFQVAETPDGVLHDHELPAFHKQYEQRHKDDDHADARAQHTHGCADCFHLTVHFRRTVAHHKRPVAVFQVFVDNELLDAALVHIGVCTCLRAVVRLDAAKDFLISLVRRLRVQK